MKRSIIGAALALSLFLAPLAYADTAPVPIGDPYTDTLQLWSEIASALSSLANDFAVLFNGQEFAAANPATPPAALAAAAANAEPAQATTITYTVQAGDTLSGIAQSYDIPLSNILAANDLSQGAILHPGENLIIPNPQTTPATSSGTASNKTSDQTTLSQNVKSANTEPSGSQNIVASAPTAPAFNTSNFVTQSELAYVLLALSTSLSTKSAPTAAPAVPLADGNPLIPYAGENNITNLSGVTITNANLTASEIPALDYFPATNTISVFYGGTGNSNAPSYGQLLIGNGSGGYSLTATSSLGITGGGGSATPAGSDTQVQFNSGGSFQGSSYFTFASSTGLLTVTNASTTDVTASYASSTNLVAGSATTTNLFASLANFTTGVISSLSGTQLTYTAASTTNFGDTGTAYFGATATTTIDSAGDLSVAGNTTLQSATTTNLFTKSSLTASAASFGATATSSFNNAGQLTLANLASAVLGVNASGQVVATTSIGANLLSGTLGVGNGGTGSTTLTGILKGNGTGAVQSAIGGTDYEFPLTFSTGLNRIGNTITNTGVLSLGSGYATTTGTTISLSTTTQSFNGLTIAQQITSPNGTDLLFTPNISGTLANSGLAHSTIVVNGTTLTLGDSGDTITAASSTLLSDTNAFSGNDTFRLLNLSATSSSLLGVNASGEVVATTSIGTNYLIGALGTVNGTPFSVGSSITVGSASTTLLGDNNTFSGANLFTASTTIGNGDQNGGFTVSGGATTTGNLVVEGNGTSTFLGNIGISGNITPSTDNTYTLGSPSYEWKDVYIGPGSLFVNGQEVVHTDASQNVVLTANSNQNLETQTSGTGSVLLNSSGTGNIQLAGPVQITGGENFSTSNSTPVLFNDGVEPGNLELTGNIIQATNTNGGISISPNGNGATYFTNGNVGIGTTNPLSKLEVEGAVAAQNFSATSTTATSTFADGINLTSGCVSLNGTCIGNSSASSTLLSDTNTFSGADSFTNASSNFGGTWQTFSPSHFDTFAYPFPLNATTTGLLLLASTTIGNGTQAGGLTINGGATTTANFLVQGTLSAQGATFAAPLSLTGTTGTTTIAAGQGFTIGGSQFVVQQGSGNVGIDTTSPATILEVDGSSGLTISTTPGIGYNAGCGVHSCGSDGSFQLLGGPNGIGSIPVPTFYPTKNNTVLALDLVPHGTPTDSGYGDAWSDICTTDQITSGNGPTDCLHMGAGTASGIFVGSAEYNSGTQLPLKLGFLNGDTGVQTVGITIQPSGNVGIGTASPTLGNLVVQGTDGVASTVTSGSFGAGFTTYTNGNTTGGFLMSQGFNTASDDIGYLDNTSGADIIITNGPGRRITFDTNGNTTFSGCIAYNGGSSGTCLSDERLKANISDFTDGLSEIVGLTPVTYQYNGLAGTPDDVQDGEVRTGLIAQQVQQVAPDLIATTTGQLNGATTTLYEVNYSALTFALINAVKQIAGISSTFEQNLIAWLGNAQNGIGEFFAQVGNFGQVNSSIDNTQELCVGSTCVTPAQFQAMVAAASDSQSSGQGSGGTPADDAQATDTPPVIQINGDNPAIIQVGTTYNDLGATITGPQADLNLGLTTYVNVSPMSPVDIDTSVAATDTIDYVATDQNGLTSTSTRTVIVEAPSIAPSDDASSTDATTTAATSTSS